VLASRGLSRLGFQPKNCCCEGVSARPAASQALENVHLGKSAIRRTIFALTVLFLAPTATMASVAGGQLVGDSELGPAAAVIQKHQITPDGVAVGQRGPLGAISSSPRATSLETVLVLVARKARRRVATRASRRRVKTTPTSKGVEITPTASRVEVDPDIVVAFRSRTHRATRKTLKRQGHFPTEPGMPRSDSGWGLRVIRVGAQP
jgi:hypothetical protein